MQTRFQFAAKIHRFCSRHSIYPLLFSSVLACAIWTGRALLSHDSTYSFLQWNLFLAWIPFLCSLAVAYLHARSAQPRWYLVVPFALWLLFLPNAPYMVTDLLHLDERPPVPFWYDLGLFVTFAWTGCFLAVVSLNIMQTVVKSWLGSAASWVFVTSTVALTGLGIYLGRFLQWNSWDLLLQPQSMLEDLAFRLAHPFSHSQMYGVSLMFSAIFLVCYLTFVSIQSRGRT